MEHVLEAARDRLHRLRARVDAVISGVTGCPIPVTEPARPIYFDGNGRGISCEAIVHAVAERGFVDALWRAALIRCHGFSKKASLIGCISSLRLSFSGTEGPVYKLKLPPELSRLGVSIRRLLS